MESMWQQGGRQSLGCMHATFLKDLQPYLLQFSRGHCCPEVAVSCTGCLLL
jgi:hypothetical protein